jgi:hypothetical protein
MRDTPLERIELKRLGPLELGPPESLRRAEAKWMGVVEELACSLAMSTAAEMVSFA